MEKINIIFVTQLAAVLGAALYFGWLLTETKYRIADRHRWLMRKPFNCRPCMTFHLGWMFSTFISISTHSLSFFIIGSALSFLIWIILEIINKGKIDP